MHDPLWSSNADLNLQQPFDMYYHHIYELPQDPLIRLETIVFMKKDNRSRENLAVEFGLSELRPNLLKGSMG